MKKRVLAYVLVMVLVLPMFSVPAYAEYDGEILFRDIPWGSNYYEVEELLNGDIVFKAERDFEYQQRLVFPLYYEKISPGNTFKNMLKAVEREGNDVVLRIGRKPRNLTVGGYNVDSIKLYFVYTIAEDGTVPLDLTHTALYCAVYDFGPYNDEENFPDSLKTEDYKVLLAKLQSIYGEGVSQNTYNTKQVWSGINQTGAVLHPYNHFDLSLFYYWEGGDALAIETRDRLAEINMTNNDDLSGL